MYSIRPHIPALRKYNYGKHIISEFSVFSSFAPDFWFKFLMVSLAAKLEKYFQKQKFDQANSIGGGDSLSLGGDYGGGYPLASPNPLH